MSLFSYELAIVRDAVTTAHPNHPKGIYAVPWYLVLGDPGSGRSAALHALNLTWKQGDGPLKTGLPQQLCTYWLPEEAVLIEPQSTVLGERRTEEHLGALCTELVASRPREPLDGVLLVISVFDFIDLDERGLDAYGNRLRKYLVEVARKLGMDVPVYIVLTRYDTLWGFAEVFQWDAERAREDPWGFNLPPNTPSQEAAPRIQDELTGLNARLEAFCLAKLSSEEPPEQRIRAFQHLAEVRAMMEKLRELFKIIAMANAFERAPWIRSVAIGCAVPGMGDKMRAGVSRFFNMGYGQGSTAALSNRRGGLPIHTFMQKVILPERDIVPLRTRWRDDTFFLVGVAAGIILMIAAGVVSAVLVR